MSKQTNLRFLFERASGLFFGPASSGHNEPVFSRHDAWLYDEYEITAIIHAYYGGPAGAEFIEQSAPSTPEYLRWRGRCGGVTKSARKLIAVRLNATLPRPNAKGKKKPRKNKVVEVVL